MAILAGLSMHQALCSLRFTARRWEHRSFSRGIGVLAAVFQAHIVALTIQVSAIRLPAAIAPGMFPLLHLGRGPRRSSFLLWLQGGMKLWFGVNLAHAARLEPTEQTS